MNSQKPVETGCLATHRMKGGTFLVTAFRYARHGGGMDGQFEILDPSTGRFQWVVDFELKRLPDPAPDNT